MENTTTVAAKVEHRVTGPTRSAHEEEFIVTADQPRYASAVDTQAFGAYRINRDPGDDRPLYRFTSRITADGASGFRAEPGRYHIYSGWFCPWAQRTIIQRALNGLEDVVSVSYVDNARDGRGWGFREKYGPDPVNGFALLRGAYDATEPGFDGHVSVPTLWDRESTRVVSNDFIGIGIDLATQFRRWSNGAVTYPEELRPEIEELDSWLKPTVNHGVHLAAGSGAEALAARPRLHESFTELDSRLRGRRYLLGSRLTEADVRLWVSLVRYDASQAGEQPGLYPLPHYPALWAYARDLYQQPAFRESTDFTTFTVPGASVSDWESEHDRISLAGAAV
jgi:putative glutathione S-transferase